MRLISLLKLATAVVTLFGSAASAWAADGTIIIDGAVMAQTCVISVNGGGTSNTVVLPQVAVSAVSAGKSAGNTPFTMAVSSCTGSATSMQVNWEYTSNVDSNGYLKNAGGTATGILVQFTSDQGFVINLRNWHPDFNTFIPLVGGAASKTYIARYISSGTTVVPTPGTFVSSISYTIVYQ